MIRRLMRWSIDISLWLALAGLFTSTLLHVVAFFSAGWLEKGRLVLTMHLGLMGLGAFTALMYTVRGELYSALALPQWAKRPLLVLFAYFLVSMMLFARYENDVLFRVRFLSSGWLAGYAAVAGYLWHLREGLLPGFREAKLY